MNSDGDSALHFAAMNGKWHIHHTKTISLKWLIKCVVLQVLKIVPICWSKAELMLCSKTISEQQRWKTHFLMVSTFCSFLLSFIKCFDIFQFEFSFKVKVISLCYWSKMAQIVHWQTRLVGHSYILLPFMVNKYWNAGKNRIKIVLK